MLRPSFHGLEPTLRSHPVAAPRMRGTLAIRARRVIGATRVIRARLAKSVRLVVLALLASGCAALTPRPRPPSPADSALARAVLQETLSEFWRDALIRRYDLALANGVRVTSLPDLSQASRKADLRLAQRIGSGLDVINVGALTESEYLTTLALRWSVDVEAEGAAFYLTDF
ncbi:MAG: hypothetical protein ABI910_19785, partial [Gemmatimonadota bacterium]